MEPILHGFGHWLDIGIKKAKQAKRLFVSGLRWWGSYSLDNTINVTGRTDIEMNIKG